MTFQDSIKSFRILIHPFYMLDNNLTKLVTWKEKMLLLFRSCFVLTLFWSSVFNTTLAQDQQQTSIDSFFVTPADTPEQVAPARPSIESNIRRAQEFTIKLNGINQLLRREMDTTQINYILPNAETWVGTIEQRLENSETTINLRFIKALTNLVNTNRGQVLDAERIVNERVAQLGTAKEQLDEIKKDDLMRYSLVDTTLLPEYQIAISLLRNRLNKTDSTLNAERLLAAQYQSRVSNVAVQIAEISDRLLIQRRDLERAIFTKENNFIWEPRSFPDTDKLVDVLEVSLRLNLAILGRFLRNHLGFTIFLGLVCYLLYYWINKNLVKIQSEKEFSDIILDRAKFVPKFPLLSALLILLFIAPIFYNNPPVSFITFLLTMSVIISGFMIKAHVSKRIFRIWLGLFGLFIISAISNLYWEVAYQERWHLLFFGLVGLYLGSRILKLYNTGKEELPYYVIVFVRIYMFMEAAAILANIFGRFSLSKMLGLTATMSGLHGVALALFVIVAKEIIYLQVEVSRNSENDFTSYIDFHIIQERVKKFFAFIGILLWGFYFLDNLSALDYILDFAYQFLTKPRTLLNASFSLENIVVFIVVIYVATILANNIAYFVSMKDQQRADNKNKRLGSSILLIRLGILSFGFMIAVAASGIPIDRITIIIGALSVGIGFGLQTIVNNLVSGIILAFEKPVQIGDTIQIGNIEGVVKDIGIRASKIKNWDGAEVIIPNGDLLSQSLTNWTLSDKKRRVDFTIGVAYNSDPDIVTALISQQLEHEEILENPPRRVFLQNFGDNSIDFRVLFWVKDVDTWVLIRNEVMRRIFKSFKENGIEIPFPQRDLYIKEFPFQENKRRKEEE
jgi:potassium-dependent mechanosensitive channel